MSRGTFIVLWDVLRPYLKRQTTKCSLHVSVEVGLAFTIWWLGTSVELQTLFGLGRSTVDEIGLATYHAIAFHLLPKYRHIPQSDSLHDFVECFQHRWRFPHRVGAIDGTHIPILKPMESASDYFKLVPLLCADTSCGGFLGEYLCMSTLVGLGRYIMLVVFFQTYCFIEEALTAPCYWTALVLLVKLMCPC